MAQGVVSAREHWLALHSAKEATVSPNRIVALLTPLVFAPAAGAASSWLARHFPGVHVKESDLQAIFIGGALIALAPAAQWLHGWQKYEARQADAETAVQVATAAGTNMPTLATGAALTDQDGGDGADLMELDALDEPDDLDELDAVGEDDLDDDLDDELLAEDGEPAVNPS
jgi:hypothetical protein